VFLECFIGRASLLLDPQLFWQRLIKHSIKAPVEWSSRAENAKNCANREKLGLTRGIAWCLRSTPATIQRSHHVVLAVESNRYPFTQIANCCMRPRNRVTIAFYVTNPLLLMTEPSQRATGPANRTKNWAKQGILWRVSLPPLVTEFFRPRTDH
jgi:hypothetical protein